MLCKLSWISQIYIRNDCKKTKMCIWIWIYMPRVDYGGFLLLPYVILCFNIFKKVFMFTWICWHIVMGYYFSLDDHGTFINFDIALSQEFAFIWLKPCFIVLLVSTMHVRNADFSVYALHVSQNDTSVFFHIRWVFHLMSLSPDESFIAESSVFLLLHCCRYVAGSTNIAVFCCF